MATVLRETTCHMSSVFRTPMGWRWLVEEDIEVFLAVVEAGSQTAAARRLGCSVQSVNRSLLALERSVGVELVRRTTRQSFATEAGQAGPCGNQRGATRSGQRARRTVG